MTRSFVWLFLVARAMTAQPAESRQAQADRIFAAFNTHTPGCAVAVSQRGAVVLRSGYGMADLERNVPITPETIFESGSVAKQFTAASVLLLARQGKISLDDPLRKYLPEIPDYGTPLTIRHVLSHLSGLREWRLMATLSGMGEGTHVLNNQDLLRFASQQRSLNFPPGTAYSYTNTGFNILTILVERALGNGKSFQDFTREAIFEPLQMTHTRWRDNFRAVVPNRALAYGRAPGGGWIQQTPIENIIGAGGMLSTVDDWLLWNENFTQAKVGGEDLLQTLQTPARLASGKTITYATGLVVDTYDGEREIGHGGSTGGYRTWLGRYPARGVSVAVMCNSAAANATELGREVARLWTGAVPAAKPAAFPADEAKLAGLAGMYRKVRDNTVVEFRLQDGRLTMDGSALVPIDATSFSSGSNSVVFEGAGFRIVTPDGDVAYERVEPVHPSAAELAPLVGAYTSPEAAATLTVAVNGEALTLTIGSGSPLKLRPTFRDAFLMQGSAVRFLRGADGGVTGLSVGDDRAWDVRFTRVR